VQQPSAHFPASVPAFDAGLVRTDDRRARPRGLWRPSRAVPCDCCARLFRRRHRCGVAATTWSNSLVTNR